MKLKKLKIKGFKKFQDFTIKFNNHKTIIVGENEVGKSTILKAIDLVLNQGVFNKIDSSLIRYLNQDNIQKFYDNPSIENLPSIEIELFLELKSIKGCRFSGLHYSDSNSIPSEGIKFSYEFDDDFKHKINIQDFGKRKILPLEFYKASWTTFQGSSYKRQYLNNKYMFLDNTNNKNDLYGNYARQLYLSKIDDNSRKDIASDFNATINEFVNQQSEVLTIDNNKKLGMDVSKTQVLNLVDIYENDISIQDMGKGKENVIKTEMSLKDNMFEVILIEEPENHLSHSNTKKLLEIINKSSNEQLIITSHSSMIVSKLNLRNVVWISENQSYTLSELDDDTARYFFKIDNLDILKFILSKKVILVEGAAEYITLPSMYENRFKTTLDNDGIEIISMGSISYKRYAKIADQLNKKGVVITDNDKKQDHIKCGKEEGYLKCYTGKNLENWTFEVAMYNANKDFFDKQYKNVGTEPNYKGENYDLALAHMLKNKTKVALDIEQHISTLTIPDYILEALQWIRK